MFSYYHLQSKSPRRDVLGIELPGEMVNEGFDRLLKQPAIKSDLLLQRGLMRPLSHVISVRKYNRLAQMRPDDPGVKSFAPIVKSVTDIGYEYFAILR